MQDRTPSDLHPVATGVWGFGVWGFSVCGLGIAGLTLHLNPHLHGAWRDDLVLATLFALSYGALGAILGLATSAGLTLVAKLRPGWAPPLGRLAVDLLTCAPLVYFLLLPDIGIARTLLTRAIFGGGFLSRAVLLAAVVLISVTLAEATRALWRRVAEGWSDTPRRRTRRALWASIPLLALVLALLLPPAGAGTFRTSSTTDAPASVTPDPAAEVPVLLLCIDGADPEKLTSMMARGELPTFSRMRDEGVWGPLETFYPSLSPVIWTTLATGRTPEDHGIHGFLVFRLPGMKRPVHQFPIHTGLNFRLFPLLEKIPNFPTLRAPYTSTMRRVRALWNIVGDHAPVGVYRWRVSWPAEPVPGFDITEGVALLGAEPGEAKHLERPDIHPPELGRELPNFESHPELAPYVTSTEGLNEEGRGAKAVLASQRRNGLEQLLYLIDRYQPALTLASFYEIDTFNHRFTRDEREGGRFAPAIEQAYRHTDARLGELLERLEGDYDVIAVSDHGYDPELDNHTHAPPGVFFAMGPDFRRGERVDLSVYDVAPLVLELLGYPAAEDMPASAQRAYLQALRPDHPAFDRDLVATYGPAPASDWSPEDSPNLDETMEQLRELGYID